MVLYIKQLLHDDSLLLFVSHSLGKAEINLHHFKKIFDNGKVLIYELHCRLHFVCPHCLVLIIVVLLR